MPTGIEPEVKYREITDSQIDAYYAQLPLDEKVILLTGDLRIREFFGKNVLREIFNPHWGKMNNYQGQNTPLTDADITKRKERILGRAKYLYKKRYRKSLLISMLIGDLPEGERAQLEESASSIFKEEWQKSKGSSGPYMQEVIETIFKEKYPAAVASYQLNN